MRLEDQKGEESRGITVQRYRALTAAAVDAKVSKADIAVLSAILERLNRRTMTAFPSFDSIAKDAHVSRRTAARGVVTLVDLGYLRRESGDRTTANIYRLGLRFEAANDDGSVTADTTCGVTPDTTGSDKLVPRGSDTDGTVTSLYKQPGKSLKDASSTHATTKKKRKVVNAENYSAGFFEFWKTYPNPVDPARCWQIWQRNDLEDEADQIVAHVRRSIEADTRWRAGFVPNPSTYLHQQRFTAEPYIAASRTERPRESAAGRAERLGNDALRRLGESGFLPRETRDDAELIAEMLQSTQPLPLFAEDDA